MARNREFDTERVVSKAMEMFWQNGYHGVSTQEMIDEFGISKSSMYGAFGDKMQLFIVALELYGSEIIKNISTRLDKCKDVAKEIRSILTETAYGAIADSEHKGCFMVNTAIELAPHHELILKMVNDHRKKLENIFADAIQKGIEHNFIRADVSPAAISKLLCTALNGIYVDSKYLRSKKYFDEIIDSVMSVIVCIHSPAFSNR
jgi:TetR/AcrR family transcriptional repressor of nem operon